ncbi:hypothetical protein, partial [Salmonella sp. s54412]|uniref:hypothetical protein n=1 Tax=Salmonella sp. s54412 TaxID=3160128 RepID=UPI0037541E99
DDITEDDEKENDKDKDDEVEVEDKEKGDDMRGVGVVRCCRDSAIYFDSCMLFPRLQGGRSCS